MKEFPTVLNPVISWMSRYFLPSDWKHIQEEIPESEWIDHILCTLLEILKNKNRLDFLRMVINLPCEEETSLPLFQKIGLIESGQIKKEFKSPEIINWAAMCKIAYGW